MGKPEPTHTQRLARLIQGFQNPGIRYRLDCKWDYYTKTVEGIVSHQACFSFNGFSVVSPPEKWHGNRADAREHTAFYALPCLQEYINRMRQ